MFFKFLNVLKIKIFIFQFLPIQNSQVFNQNVLSLRAESVFE